MTIALPLNSRDTARSAGSYGELQDLDEEAAGTYIRLQSPFKKLIRGRNWL